MENMPNESENEPKKISPIIEYYMKAYYSSPSYSDIVMSVSTLLDKIPTDNRPTIEEIAANGYFPFDWEVDNDPRIAKEKLAILPFACLSDCIDNSNMDVDDVKRWYAEAYWGYQLLNTGADGEAEHSSVCANGQSANTTLCTQSARCPHRFMEQYVKQCSMNPDFSQAMYTNDPKRAYDIIEAKLHASGLVGILEENYMKSLWKEYRRVHRLFKFNITDQWSTK